MNVLASLFGHLPPARTELAFFDPARAAGWRRAHVKKGSKPVRASLAQGDGSVRTAAGSLHFRAGEHYIIERGRDRFVVRRDIFERTYRLRKDGLHEKRTDIVYRYVIAQEPVLVRTLEGIQRAEAGDWIVQGVAGEVWPVAAVKARTLYAPLKP
jgi:hypothetical protein